MGDRHNRKRTRPRTSATRRQHRLEPTPIQPGPLYAVAPGSERTPIQTSVSIRYHQGAPTRPHSHKWSTSSSFCVSGEDDKSRDLRIFGGDESDGQSMEELRGPMLDVVFGLFNGVDFDDEGMLGGVMT